jgi:hypothetical protein
VSKPQQLVAPHGKSACETHEVEVPPRAHEQVHTRSFDSFLHSMR